MSDVKDELKNVLESKKRFTEVNVERVFQKIDEKQMKKKVYWKPLFAGFSILTALLTLFFLLPKQHETSVHEMSAQMEEKLVQKFKEFSTTREIIYTKIGYEKDNVALIIAKAPENEFDNLVALYEYENKEWKEMYKQVLDNPNLFVTDKPQIIYSGMISNHINHLFVGEKEVKPIRINDSVSIFVTMHDVKTDHVVIHHSNNKYWDESERLLFSSCQFNYDFLSYAPLVNREGDEYIYDFNEEAMQTYDKHYFEKEPQTEFELVVDPSFDLINRFDVVLVDDGVNTAYLSRVVALPDDRFGVENGTIILNEEPQHNPYGSAKADGYFVADEYIKNHSLSKNEEEKVRDIFTMNVPETYIPPNQYMLVSDNWLRGEMTLVKKEQIKGVVKGYYIDQLANEWTAEEKQLYEQMKTTKNKQLLANLDPKTIMRLYLYASYLADREMQYYFFTTTEDYIESTFEKYMEVHHFVSDAEIRESYLLAKGLRESKFVQDGEFGYLKFSIDRDISFKLIKNAKGYWEVAFNPMKIE